MKKPKKSKELKELLALLNQLSRNLTTPAISSKEFALLEERFWDVTIEYLKTHDIIEFVDLISKLDFNSELKEEVVIFLRRNYLLD